MPESQSLGAVLLLQCFCDIRSPGSFSWLSASILIQILDEAIMNQNDKMVCGKCQIESFHGFGGRMTRERVIENRVRGCIERNHKHSLGLKKENRQRREKWCGECIECV